MTDTGQRLTVEDFDFDLPEALIAQHPAPERTGSRLMRLARERVSDHAFADLPRFLAPGDVLVFNDTRVIKARLVGAKDSGGRVEVLIERVVGAHEALAQVRASHAPRPGARLRLASALDATVLARDHDLFRLKFDGRESVLTLLDRHGSVPLPPYIAHPPEAADERRYQTVYARTPGAVAAPTAGLHFDEPLLDQLRAQGVETAFLTLHVGAGTFQPVRVTDLVEHRMHGEWYEIPAEAAETVGRAHARGRDVIAVGTTALRALEASALATGVLDGTVAPGSGETDLFITPGFRFRVVDRLVTNFHLPRSTLLMLVSAFAGVDAVRAAYRHAVAGGYRFFSYGDAMLVDKIAG